MPLDPAVLSIVDARLWDGTGTPPRGPLTIQVAGGKILAIGEDLSTEGTVVLDAKGATVIPGLIDSHVHLSLDPGAGWRRDTPEDRDGLLHAHLRALLACGVTTVLDPAVLPVEEARIRATSPGPRYLSLGAPFSPPEGYVTVVIPSFPSVATREEVERQLDASVGQAGIKVTVERGFRAPIWPLHPRETLEAIRDGARARGLDIYAHAMSVREQRLAVEVLDADVTVHALEVPHRPTIRRLAEAGVYEMTTLSPTAAFAPEGIDDLWLDRYVPAVELATARDPEVARGFTEQALELMAPRVPLPRWIARSGLAEQRARAHLRRAGRALRALADAGVPLVMGSDSGNWPMIPSLFHGPSSIRELELLVDAGLGPEAALLAATRTPAEMLGLEVGVVAPGRPADLVVVNGDPLADVRALRDLRWVVRDGEARTPEGWLGTAAPPGAASSGKKN